MINAEQLHTLAQLVENIDILTGRLEKSYNNNDAENFNSAKKEILDIQTKISSILK